MRKNILPSIFLLILACASAMHVSAAYSEWDGTTKTEVTITGTSVTISTAAELAWLADKSASYDFAGKTVVLENDIDLKGYKWTPIGTAATPFKGKFDGNGTLIRGLRAFDGSDGVGLFGYLGSGGRIEQIGISGGTLVAKPKRRIGALVGVCDGTISTCWTMAEIAAAGNVVGGLVGELTANGEIIDCYNAGLILNASDTIGGIVGYNNGGKLTRVYNTGYAKNGKAIVGIDENGKYEKCYYDRKLYYQQPGVVNQNVIPVDETEKMYDIFDGLAVWATNVDDKIYPMLRAFAAMTAAKLSVAPMFIEKDSKDPVNHANDLLESFTVSTKNGVTWTCQDAAGEEWIKISGDNVAVVRPCSETDVLVDTKLGDETRVVYMRPRRWDDFQPGIFFGEKKDFCFKEEAEIDGYVSQKPAEYGWEIARYYYLIERSEILTNGDTIPLDTLYNGEINPMKFEDWMNDQDKIPTDKAGWFVLRRYAHDSVCVLDWLRSEGQFIYRVFDEFDPGKIVSGRDTIYLNTIPETRSVASVRPASGGGGDITYQWLNNGSAMDGTDTESLSYDFSEAGTYTFTRSAIDSAQCGAADNIAEGEYTFVVFDKFDPGRVNEEADKKFCTVEDAKAYIVSATSATGGSGTYHYRWYISDGSTKTLISGATGQTLSLASMDLEAGKYYTFTREAEDDTRFTTWEQSAQEQKIYIMKELSPGAIKNGELPKECVVYMVYYTDPSSSLTVKVEETTSSRGETDREFRWIRLPDNVVIATTEELNYTFPISDIVLGTTYTYVREVRNPGCDWQRSSGEATQYYGESLHAEQTITVCDEDMPYTLEWYTADGVRSTHTFYSATDTWLATDNSFDCPHDTLFSVDVVEVPELKIESNASFCQSTGTMTIYFEQTAALSDIFHITYSTDLAKYMGMTDTTGTITAPGTILLENIPSIGTGDIYLLVQIGYSDGTGEGLCFSRSQKMNLYVSLGGYVHSKYDRVLFVDNNPDNGIDVGTAEKLEFKAYQWYKNGVAQEGQTGQYYHEDGKQLNGVYYVMLTDTKDRQYRSCDVVMPAETEANAPQNTAVYPVPANAGQAMTIEGNGTVQITSFSGECVTRFEVNGSATVTAPRVAGMYYVQITNAAGEPELHKLIVK
ncbi:MAG: T9SS type A sorting domain-containing protein [Paludibacteraceae bacterium]|nr:T9SS type A sorting domain-containing protein [Paludibacteraceae bacterium]